MKAEDYPVWKQQVVVIACSISGCISFIAAICLLFTAFTSESLYLTFEDFFGSRLGVILVSISMLTTPYLMGYDAQKKESKRLYDEMTTQIKKHPKK